MFASEQICRRFSKILSAWLICAMKLPASPRSAFLSWQCAGILPTCQLYQDEFHTWYFTIHGDQCFSLHGGDVQGNALYAQRGWGGLNPSPWAPRIDLPRIDLNEANQEAVFHTMRYRHNVRWNGVPLGQERGRCPFIERGSLSIGWNGEVSPCLALMHNYLTYLNDVRRTVRRYSWVTSMTSRSEVNLGGTGVCRLPQACGGLRLLALYLVRRLQLVGEERGGLLRQHLPDLRRLSLGTRCDPVPVGTIPIKE